MLSLTGLYSEFLVFVFIGLFLLLSPIALLVFRKTLAHTSFMLGDTFTSAELWLNEMVTYTLPDCTHSSTC